MIESLRNLLESAVFWIAVPGEAIQPLVVLGAAAIGSVGAYVAATRRLSGSIKTSEAEDLWTEARSIREEYRSQIKVALAHVVDLEARIVILERENVRCIDENRALSVRNNLLEETIEDMRQLVSAIERENKQLKGDPGA